jgi:hypothetical protein
MQQVGGSLGPALLNTLSASAVTDYLDGQGLDANGPRFSAGSHLDAGRRGHTPVISGSAGGHAEQDLSQQAPCRAIDSRS